MSELEVSHPYPVVFDVDHAPSQSRWKAAVRLPLSLPAIIFTAFLQGGIAIAIWLTILVRGQIPTWLFDYQIAVNRWAARTSACLLILTDEYPPFDGEHAVRYDVDPPRRLSRRKVLFWKLITSIPHFILLASLGLTLIVAVPFSWFAVVLTGRYPAGLHDHVVGTLRWGARVHAYVLSLTDEPPPFSMLAEPAARLRHTNVLAPAIGLAVVGALVAYFGAIWILSPGDIVAEVSYERLLAGDTASGETLVQVDSREDAFDFNDTGYVELTAASDPADALLPLLVAAPGHRLVALELTVENESWVQLEIRDSYFVLEDREGNKAERLVVLADGRPPPMDLDRGESTSVIVFFEIPVGVLPAEFRFRMDHHVHRTLTYRFI